MSSFTEYSDFIEGSEDPSTQSGQIFRHPLAINGLKTGLEGEEKSLYDGFLRGSRLTKTGNCLGMRPVVDNVEQPYKWFSYAEVGKMIDKLSSEMIHQNLCNESLGCGLSVSDGTEARLVGIYVKTRYEWLVAEYACYRCNATVVTMYDSLGVDATKYILNLAKLETVFCGGEAEVQSVLSIMNANPNEIFINAIIYIDLLSDDMMMKLDEKKIRHYHMQSLIDQCSDVVPPRHPQPHDICTICFTSGTTGNPKGVIISHQTLLSLTLSINQHFGISFTPCDIVVAYLPLAHMFERFVEVNAIFNGACIGYWQGSNEKLMSDLVALRPTAFCAVPRILQRIRTGILSKVDNAGSFKKKIFNHALGVKIKKLTKNTCKNWFYDKLVFNSVAVQTGLDRLRWLLTGSAPIANELVEFMECVLSTTILNGYGNSEAAGGLCCSAPADISTVGHCGGPVSGIECKLMSVPEKKYYITDCIHYRDTHDTVGVPVCGRGEMCIRGPGVFLGYFKNEEETSASIDSDGWFHTGDICYVNRDNGGVQVIDRIKNLLKLSQGEYVAVEKVENVYLKNSLVDQMFIYGEGTQNYVVAVVVPAKGELMRQLRAANICDISNIPFDAICVRNDVKWFVIQSLNKTAVEANLYYHILFIICSYLDLNV